MARIMKCSVVVWPRLLAAVWSVVAVGIAAAESAEDGSVAKAGPLADENFFPLAVWLQNPANAAKYRAAGINVYVALSRRAGDKQFAELAKQGIFVVCGQNEATLARKDNPTIIAWMHGDEPDNAQRIRGEKGYGPPILP